MKFSKLISQNSDVKVYQTKDRFRGRHFEKRFIVQDKKTGQRYEVNPSELKHLRG